MIAAILFTAGQSHAQNLVPNPSFEEYENCPNNLGQVYNVSGWASTRLSPDYFNACSSGGFNSPSVPHNYWGYQIPSSGNAYCGFAARYGPDNIREFLGASLNQSLQSGTEYFASFKVSLSFKDTNSLSCAVNNLGMLLTMNQYSEANPAPICNCAQVYETSIISDTSAWITVSGSFIADSNYTFINIGNFFSDLLTDSIQIHGQVCDAYYYIDDVCLSADSNYCYNYHYTSVDNIKNINNINIYPNPFCNDLTIADQSQICLEFSVFSFLGNELLHSSFDRSIIHHIDMNILPKGTYILKILKINNLIDSYIITKT